MNMQHAPSIKIKSVKNLKRSPLTFKQNSKLFVKALLLLVIFLGLGFGTTQVYQGLCSNNFFQITAVKIDGNRMTSKKQIATLSRVDIHSNLLALNVTQVKALLESHPWIAKADVIRDWPNRLLINVKEKRPVALLSRESGLFYLDHKGHMIAAVSHRKELDFPVVTGLENFIFSATASAQIPKSLKEILALLKLADKNKSILFEQSISEIHVSSKGELILYLLDRPFPIYLGTDGKISTRYYRLVKVLKDLYRTREFSKVSYIRLDYQKDTILVGKLKSDRNTQG